MQPLRQPDLEGNAPTVKIEQHEAVRVFVAYDFAIQGTLPSWLKGAANKPPPGFIVEWPGSKGSKSQGEIWKHIVEPGLKRCSRCLAFLDLPNANVGFEVGYALGLGKKVALSRVRPDLPPWIMEPPLNGFMCPNVKNLDAVRAMISGDHWVSIESKPSPGEDVLVLCPPNDGQAYLEEIDELWGWRKPLSTGWDLTSLPAQLSGVGLVLWVIAPHNDGTSSRDGKENAALSVIAGYARSQPNIELAVLAHSSSRLVADVVGSRTAFGDSDTFGDLALRVVDKWRATRTRTAPSSSNILADQIRRKVFHCAEKEHETLDLSGMGIETLPPEIGTLQNLKVLDLSHNALTLLPPEIGSLELLTAIHLDNNKLQRLNVDLQGLKKLKLLDISSNNLTELPQFLWHMPELETLLVSHNDGLGITAELQEQKLARTILDGYAFLRRQGQRQLNEVRIAMAGRGGVGKTSLVRKLLEESFDPSEAETMGVAVSKWRMPELEGEPVTASIWDFSGQIITHSMHQYFFSRHTIYILVVSQREDTATEDAVYWLNLVSNFGSECGTDGALSRPPVVLALNKSDTSSVRLDRGALCERYPFIVGFVETDCLTGRGIDELRAKLCKLMNAPNVMPWVRKVYPKQWWDVKEAIGREQLSKPHLTYEEWGELCSKYGVKDRASQDELSRDLHSLGVALNYADDNQLRDNTVLSPNWLTHNCYALIRHAEKHSGEIRRAELPGVLGSSTEGEDDPRMQFYLMKIMERFDAAYPLGEDWPPERWLVPLGLPESQPDGVETFGKIPPSGATRLRYTYTSVPPGLMARFIVRTHPLMELSMQWANGTVLSLNDSRALIRISMRTQIEVTVIGSGRESRRDLAGLCREELSLLHKQIKGLSVLEETEVVAEKEVIWASVNALEQSEIESRGQTFVATEKGILEVDVSKALNEFGTEDARLTVDPGVILSGSDSLLGYKPRKFSRKPRVFIIYCHNDERYRKTLELHLSVLKVRGLVDPVWYNQSIQPGMAWEQITKQELAKADVILILTSTALLASGYINSIELEPTFERYSRSEASVVPIILEQCAWISTFASSPPFVRTTNPKNRIPQCLPREGKAIRSFHPQSLGWHDVSKGLETLLAKVKSTIRDIDSNSAQKG